MRIHKLIYKFSLLFKYKLYSFSSESSAIKDIKLLKNLINAKDENKKVLDDEFINLFKKKIGSGYALTFGAGRMAFFYLLKKLNYSEGKDILLPGVTCSVMVNAVLKAGLNPIFYDIDENSLGSSLTEIKKMITQNTCLVVAQHTYGIPCKIDEIKNYCNKNNIFLLEDCSLSYGSKYKDIFLGNFGDASLFSFDRSKTINTFTGGLLYTNDNNLYDKLNENYSSIPDLNKKKQLKIYRRILLECLLNNPYFYSKLVFIEPILKIFNIFQNSFLNSDYTEKFHNNYEYPCKYPTFLSQIGILKLKKIDITFNNRKKFLLDIIDIFKKKNLLESLPKSYFDKNNNIIPLRILFYKKNKIPINKKLLKILDEKSFWYKGPIDSCTIDPDLFYYIKGSCKKIEENNDNFINLPCNHNREHLSNLIGEVERKI